MKKYRDKRFASRNGRILDIISGKCYLEHLKQIKKWGIQEITIFEWFAFATEEFGESIQAIMQYEYREGSKEHIKKELIQTITLLSKIYEFYDKED